MVYPLSLTNYHTLLLPSLLQPTRKLQQPAKPGLSPQMLLLRLRIQYIPSYQPHPLRPTIALWVFLLRLIPLFFGRSLAFELYRWVGTIEILPIDPIKKVVKFYVVDIATEAAFWVEDEQLIDEVFGFVGDGLVALAEFYALWPGL